MDEATVRRTEAQLTYWGAEIGNREARLLLPGRQPRFLAVLHVDELRVLLVTARARFEALQTCPTGHQDLLAAEFDQARKELAAAIKRRLPPP